MTEKCTQLKFTAVLVGRGGVLRLQAEPDGRLGKTDRTQGFSLVVKLNEVLVHLIVVQSEY